MITISNTVFKGRSIVRQLTPGVLNLSEDWGNLNTSAPLIAVSWGDLNTDRELEEEVWGVAAPTVIFSPRPGPYQFYGSGELTASRPVTWSWTFSSGPNYTLSTLGGGSSPYYGTGITFAISTNGAQERTGEVYLTATDDEGNVFNWVITITSNSVS